MFAVIEAATPAAKAILAIGRTRPPDRLSSTMATEATTNMPSTLNGSSQATSGDDRQVTPACWWAHISRPRAAWPWSGCGLVPKRLDETGRRWASAAWHLVCAKRRVSGCLAAVTAARTC